MSHLEHMTPPIPQVPAKLCCPVRNFRVRVICRMAICRHTPDLRAQAGYRHCIHFPTWPINLPSTSTGEKQRQASLWPLSLHWFLLLYLHLETCSVFSSQSLGARDKFHWCPSFLSFNLNDTPLLYRILWLIFHSKQIYIKKTPWSSHYKKLGKSTILVGPEYLSGHRAIAL